MHEVSTSFRFLYTFSRYGFSHFIKSVSKHQEVFATSLSFDEHSKYVDTQER